MAYYSNGSEGAVFYEQCSKCKYGDDFCPIAYVQEIYNYDAVNNEIATNILNDLVEQDGTCAMFKEFKKDFELDYSDEKYMILKYGELLKCLVSNIIA